MQALSAFAATVDKQARVRPVSQWDTFRIAETRIRLRPNAPQARVAADAELSMNSQAMRR